MMLLTNTPINDHQNHLETDALLLKPRPTQPPPNTGPAQHKSRPTQAPPDAGPAHTEMGAAHAAIAKIGSIAMVSDPCVVSVAVVTARPVD